MHTRTPRKVVHNDVKPENILVYVVDGAYEFKIADVGIAELTSAGGGSMMFAGGGTLPYLSPEKAGNKPFHCDVDVYALGVSLVEAVLGTREFRKYFSDGRAQRAAIDDALAVLREAGEGLVVALIDGCCKENPAERLSAANGLLLLSGSSVR